jgi:hypothetical protein
MRPRLLCSGLLAAWTLLGGCGGPQAEPVAEDAPDQYQGALVARRGEEVLQELPLSGEERTEAIGPGDACEATISTSTLRTGGRYYQVQVRCQLEGGVTGMGGHCVSSDGGPPRRPSLEVRPSGGEEPFELAVVCR